MASAATNLQLSLLILHMLRGEQSGNAKRIHLGVLFQNPNFKHSWPTLNREKLLLGDDHVQNLLDNFHFPVQFPIVESWVSVEVLQLRSLTVHGFWRCRNDTHLLNQAGMNQAGINNMMSLK